MIGEIFFIAISLVVGVAIGIINFAGMWSTIHYLSQVKHPAILMMLSFIVRMAIIMTTFYFVMDGRWERLIACMVGFFLVRRVLMKRFLPERYHSK